MTLSESLLHLTRDELDAGLNYIRESPAQFGTLKMIVRRPSEDVRETLQEATLDPEVGLVGDNWKDRPSRHTPDKSPNPLAQLTLMNSRVVALIARIEERWALAGDQLYVDIDLSVENLPPGTRLAIGTAIVEITEQPHTGCAKFSQRFGVEAHKFVNSEVGKPLRMRGVNAKVILGGKIEVGDTILVSLI